jgi:hypothetical protein
VWWPRSRIAPIQNYGLFTRGGGGSCLFGGRRGHKSLGSFFGNRLIKCEEEEGEAGKTVFFRRWCEVQRTLFPAGSTHERRRASEIVSMDSR